MVLNPESYQSDTSDVPPSCIYTGYTPQYGNSILYRDNLCFSSELVNSKIGLRSDSDPARTRAPIVRYWDTEISRFKKTDMENPVLYNSTAVPADRPPKTESTVYVQVLVPSLVAFFSHSCSNG